MKKVLYILLLVFFSLSNNYCNSKHEQKSENADSLKTIQNQIDTIWITSVGDLMCHEAQLKDAYSDGSYNFTKVFEFIEPYLSRADLTIGNIETVLGGSEKRFTGYPMFNSPDEYAVALKESGFDVLTTTNNHCLDRSFSGLERTIEILDKNELRHTGTFKTEEESRQVLITEVKGIKLAILAYTYGTNGIPVPSGKEFSVNYIDLEKIKSDIESVKLLNPDKIIVCLHWGVEYQRTPNNNQKKIADEIFSLGADIILGNHPHVIQPLETRTMIDEIDPSKGEKKVFIIYSMGNFISNQRKRFTDSGVIINIQLIKNKSTNETIIGEINFIPTYVSTATGSFRIIPVYEAKNVFENNLTNSELYIPGIKSRIYQVWDETVSHLMKEENNILPYEVIIDKTK